jgi:Flp pilus assembly secretin CpaC
MFSNLSAQKSSMKRQVFHCVLLTLFLHTTGSLSISEVKAEEKNDQNIITHSTSNALMKITLNQITLVRLEDKISDALIGNPAIADITIQNNSTFIITGKSYGRTNIILLNKDGEKIFDRWVYVDDDSRNVVRIQRGGARLSYTCAPNCQPTPTLGDDPEHIKSLTKNFQAKLQTIDRALKQTK